MEVATVAYVWDSFILHVAARAESSLHVHSSLQLALGLGAPVSARTTGGDWVEGDCVLVATNVAHAFRSEKFALFWIEPDSDAGRRLTEAYSRHAPIARLSVAGLGELSCRAAAMLEQPTSCEEAWAFAMGTLATLVGELPRPRALHPAIRKALRIIEAQPHSRIPAKQLAADVGLSEGRFSHAFRDELGVPLRRFLMWQRLRRAVVLLVHGTPVSEVAHAVGCADAAHLNRMFRMMLGLRPSALQAARQLRLHVCARPSEIAPRSRP